MYELIRRDGASIILIVHGEGKINEPSELILSRGKVFMLTANVTIKIHVGTECLELYQTFVNL